VQPVKCETVINQEINAIYLASNEAQHGGAFATSRPESQNPERRALGPYRPVPIPIPIPIPLPLPLDHAPRGFGSFDGQLALCRQRSVICDHL